MGAAAAVAWRLVSTRPPTAEAPRRGAGRPGVLAAVLRRACVPTPALDERGRARSPRSSSASSTSRSRRPPPSAIPMPTSSPPSSASSSRCRWGRRSCSRSSSPAGFSADSACRPSCSSCRFCTSSRSASWRWQRRSRPGRVPLRADRLAERRCRQHMEGPREHHPGRPPRPRPGVSHGRSDTTRNDRRRRRRPRSPATRRTRVLYGAGLVGPRLQSPTISRIRDAYPRALVAALREGRPDDLRHTGGPAGRDLNADAVGLAVLRDLLTDHEVTARLLAANAARRSRPSRSGRGAGFCGRGGRRGRGSAGCPRLARARGCGRAAAVAAARLSDTDSSVRLAALGSWPAPGLTPPRQVLDDDEVSVRALAAAHLLRT